MNFPVHDEREHHTMNSTGRLAYSIKETCELLGLGKTRVYELANSGELKTKKIGRRTLVVASSLRELITPVD